MSGNVIDENASRLRALHKEMHAAYREQNRSPRHIAAAQAFREAYDALAFPNGLEVGLKALKDGDPDAIENAIRFIEANPFFHRSGYIKEEIIRRLKHVDLTTDQIARLRTAVLASLTGGWHMPKQIGRLARRVDSLSFRKEVTAAADSPISETRSRAQHILSVLQD
jgi:hypothetical protein